ncbi:glycine betaine ABC transporter substrate-binding protein, partial [Pseudomonas aeruginosa]|uniref:glycine betaine ABC transporter substrate-binding protein n=1 Tax=Pseudomonas aeruginosa TaxID=287 RepID=UPI003CC6D970
PQYVYVGGRRIFADNAKFSDRLGNKINGIEPGNDGNPVAQSMIDKNAFELGKFMLVECSEAGMHSQVQRAIRRNQWV